MLKKFTVDELIKNDSFINYCFHTNPDDVEEWQTYLLNYPDEIKMVKEAKQFVLLMNQMLEEHSAEFSHFNTPENIENIPGIIATEPKEQSASLTGIPTKTRIRSIKRYLYYAAASVILVVGTFLLKTYFLNIQPTAGLQTQPVQTADYETAIAQKKTIRLPDSTLVVLNAKTSLHIDKGFGTDSRIVTLIGEAFFDVKHNQQKPFIVQTNACKIKVLGTAFNVKAYPGETTSETSLLRGSIELTIKNDNNRKYSLINYLNENWLEEDGGQLLVYQNDTVQKISPQSQTAVFFKSDEIEHEVILAHRNRMSITGWLKRI